VGADSRTALSPPLPSLSTPRGRQNARHAVNLFVFIVGQLEIGTRFVLRAVPRHLFPHPIALRLIQNAVYPRKPSPDRKSFFSNQRFHSSLYPLPLFRGNEKTGGGSKPLLCIWLSGDTALRRPPLAEQASAYFPLPLPIPPWFFPAPTVSRPWRDQSTSPSSHRHRRDSSMRGPLTLSPPPRRQIKPSLLPAQLPATPVHSVPGRNNGGRYPPLEELRCAAPTFLLFFGSRIVEPSAFLNLLCAPRGSKSTCWPQPMPRSTSFFSQMPRKAQPAGFGFPRRPFVPQWLSFEHFQPDPTTFLRVVPPASPTNFPTSSPTFHLATPQYPRGTTVPLP